MATVEIELNGEEVFQTMSVELDGTRYRMRLEWSEFAVAWFMSLYSDTEPPEPIALHRRISPGSSPYYTFRTGGPRGVFLVYGPTAPPYGQAALGRSVRLLYVEASP